jgi:hypothetical protein
MAFVQLSNGESINLDLILSHTPPVTENKVEEGWGGTGSIKIRKPELDRQYQETSFTVTMQGGRKILLRSPDAERVLRAINKA